MFMETGGRVHSSWWAMCETSHFPCGLAQLSTQKMFITKGKKSKVNGGDYGERGNSTLKVKTCSSQSCYTSCIYWFQWK